MKSTQLKILFIAVLMMAIIPAVQAFQSTLTLQGGITIPFTDINADKTLKPMYGITYEAWIKNHLSIALNPYYTQLDASDGSNNYESTIIGADIFMKMRATKFLALNFSDKAVIRRIAPFVGAGVGLVHYESNGNIDDGNSTTNDRFEDSGTVFVAPHLSAGISILTKWNFNIDFGVKADYTTTDWIDNLKQPDYNDGYYTPYIGIGFNFGLPKETIIPEIMTSGNMREFSAQKGSPSAAQMFNLTGTGLKKNITITAPNGYELSIDGGKNYVKSATVAPTFNGPIMVRMLGSNAGNYNGNVVLSSEGAPNVNLYVLGTVTDPQIIPVLAVNGTFSSFSTDKGTPSAAQRYTLSGSDLKGEIDITAPSGYEISTDGGASYAKTAKLNPNFNGTVLVRLTGDNVGTYNGNLVINSEGAKNIVMPITGTVRDAGMTESTDVVLHTVHFDTNLYVLSNSDKSLLDAVAASLKSNTTAKLQIQGHTDNTGNDAINNPLGRNRAMVVKDYLVSKGIAASRLETIGFADTKPVQSNDTPEGRAANRRAEFIVQK